MISRKKNVKQTDFHFQLFTIFFSLFIIFCRLFSVLGKTKFLFKNISVFVFVFTFFSSSPFFIDYRKIIKQTNSEKSFSWLLAKSFLENRKVMRVGDVTSLYLRDDL